MAIPGLSSRTVFYKNHNEDWDESYQLIVCENGIFRKQRVNSLCYITRKMDIDIKALDGIEYRVIGKMPITMEEKPYMTKRIPHKLIETLLKFYQVYAKKNLEVRVNIWYDKIEDKFFLDAPFQRITSVTVREYSVDNSDIVWSEALISEFPDKKILKEKLSRGEIETVIETHSHHNMSCSFSETDNNSEYVEFNGYGLFGVYITVLKNPRFLSRYFIPNKLGLGKKAIKDINKYEVAFDVKDIVDYDSDFEEKYDFNIFAKHVNVSKDLLFGEHYTGEY